MQDVDREMIVDLLEAIWRGMPPDYKSRYRWTIWTQFESQIRSAAYTNSLATFVNSLCLKLQANIGSNAEHRQRVEQVLENVEDGAGLRMIRAETAVLVLMVRLRNEQRSRAWHERQDEIEAEEAALNEPLFATLEAEG